MTAFATADDLATYLNRDLDAGEQAQAELMLGIASGHIRREVAQTISLVTDDVAVLRGNWTPRLRLPERPVVSVSSVVIDGSPALSAVDYRLVGDTLVRGWWDGVVVNRSEDSGSGHWGGDRKVTVTYTHGFATIPDEIKGVCLAMVARSIQIPDGAVQETTGSHSVTFKSSGAVGLDADERATLRQWLRQQQA